MKAPIKFRAASNGKPFTRTERISIINAKAAKEKRRAAISAAVAEAKREFAEENKIRNLGRKRIQAMIDHPTEKIKTKKGGVLFYQPRGEKGRLCAAVTIH